MNTPEERHHRRRTLVNGTTLLIFALTGLVGCQKSDYPMAIKVERNPVAYVKPKTPPPAGAAGPAISLPVPVTPAPGLDAQQPLRVPVYTAPIYHQTGGHQTGGQQTGSHGTEGP